MEIFILVLSVILGFAGILFILALIAGIFPALREEDAWIAPLVGGLTLLFAAGGLSLGVLVIAPWLSTHYGVGFP